MRYFIALSTILVAHAALAGIVTNQVEYKAGGATMKGQLAYDDAQKGGRPGVLIVHEWWGLGEHAIESAKKLAEQGYVALAVDMYGEAKSTTDPKEAGAWSGEVKGNVPLMRERFEAAMKALGESKVYDGQHLAAIGYCFGGTVVLEMARAGLDLDGVVSFHGGLKTEQVVAKDGIKARVLVCHGADDPFESAEEIAAFQQQMRDAGADWQFNIYSGAEHSFTNPKANMKGARYNEKAAKRSWEDMGRFLKEVFGGK